MKPLKTSGKLQNTTVRKAETLRSPRPLLTTLLVVVLAGFGITAFGIAPLTPDVSRLPQRTVSELTVTPGLRAQLDQLADHELQLVRNGQTRIGDTADSLLRRLGVDDPLAAAFIRIDPIASRLLEGRTAKMVQATASSNGVLLELIARYPAERAEQVATHFTRLHILNEQGRWKASLATAPMVARQLMGSGTIQSSLFAATDEAGLNDGIPVQLAQMFSGDIDFHRGLRRGDTFSVVYESLTADGEPILWDQTAGRVVAAEFVNKGRSYSSVWFRDSQGKGGYFDFKGRSKRRAFLSSPLEFTRVTSGFEMRVHPILQAWRQHLGIDYAASTGTPVRSVGNGMVEFAGWQNGYGNVVKINHGGNRQTIYAHLSRVDVRLGQRVDQGQHVGAVGATGWATGPHLHFEFRINGQQQNPMDIAQTADTMKLDAATAREFAELAPSWRAQLDVAQTLGKARDE